MIHLAKVSRADYLLLLHDLASREGQEVVEVHGVVDPGALDAYRAAYGKYDQAVQGWIAGELDAVRDYVAAARAKIAEYENRVRAEPDAVVKARMGGVLRDAERRIPALEKALAGAESGRDAALQALAALGRGSGGKPPPAPDAYLEEVRQRTKPERVTVCDVTLFATVADAGTGETLSALKLGKRHTSCAAATAAIETRLVALLAR